MDPKGVREQSKSKQKGRRELSDSLPAHRDLADASWQLAKKDCRCFHEACAMPRQARIEVPGIPMHVTQRGVNRCAIFLDDDDRHHYRRLLREACTRHAVLVHAYVLMGNHVHLLVSAERALAFSRAMCLLGQGYVPAFNRRHGRTGTLWEGRFRSCLVDSEGYLLTAYRYIELNPVRAGMVERAEDYPWSSVRANLGVAGDPLVTPHAQFIAMGTDLVERSSWYRAWLDQAVPPDDLDAFRTHAAQERAFGSTRFQAMVAATLNREVSVRRRGRPRREPVADALVEEFKR